MDKPIAVVDTSALVSASTRRRLILAAQENLCKLYWSPWIIAELTRVLTVHWIERHGTSKQSLITMSKASKTMMTWLTTFFDIADPKPPWEKAWPALSDADDLPIYTTASRIKANFVVSENTRDFPPLDKLGRHIWNGIEYIHPQEFLARLEFEEDET